MPYHNPKAFTASATHNVGGQALELNTVGLARRLFGVVCSAIDQLLECDDNLGVKKREETPFICRSSRAKKGARNEAMQEERLRSHSSLAPTHAL